MGRYQRTASGGLALGSPRNQQTNVPGIYAIGECDYQYHGANRLGANSLLSCIFSGLIVAPAWSPRSIPEWPRPAEGLASLLERHPRAPARYKALLPATREIRTRTCSTSDLAGS